jgi:hypothetical protein
MSKVKVERVLKISEKTGKIIIGAYNVVYFRIPKDIVDFMLQKYGVDLTNTSSYELHVSVSEEYDGKVTKPIIYFEIFRNNLEKVIIDAKPNF